MFTHIRRAAVLLGLILGLSCCQAQDATGYALPDVFMPAPKLTQRAYLVADIVVPMQGSKEQPAKPLHESLMTLLRNTIEPESWEGRGGRGTIEYFPLGMTLVVNQTEDIQKGILELLTGLRKAQDVEVAVEVKILHLPLECAKEIDAQPMPAAGSQTKVRMLDEGQVKKLLAAAEKDRRANIVQAPKITVFNGQDSHIECLQTQQFDTGIDIRWNGEKIVPTPHHESFETGFRMNLQPVVVPNQKTIRLHFQAKLTSLDGKSKSAAVQTTVAAEGKDKVTDTLTIQTPKLTTINVDRVLTIAEASTAMLSGWTQEVDVDNSLKATYRVPYYNRLVTASSSHKETHSVVLLVTPRIVVPEKDQTWTSPVERLNTVNAPK